MAESGENREIQANQHEKDIPVETHGKKKGMPYEDARTLGQAVLESSKMDKTAEEHPEEAAYRKARRKALEIIFYANEHIRYPCGGSLEEQVYQRKVHQHAVGEALLEPGVLNTMTDDEVSHLNRLLKMK